MEVLFPKEKLLLSLVVQRNPDAGKLLKQAIGKIFIHLPERLLYEKYNPVLVREFLDGLVRRAEEKGLEQYYSMVTKDETSHAILKKCCAADDLEQNILKSMGAYGFSKLIEDLLKKMAEKDFGKQEIKSLVALIETRNKMRQSEERFLNAAFRKYLEKQISLYS